MSKKRRQPPKTIGDLVGGDIVTIGEETYRAMIKAFDAWGCRKLQEDGEWSTSYTWHLFTAPLTRIVKLSPEAGSGKQAAEVDPLGGME